MRTTLSCIALPFVAGTLALSAAAQESKALLDAPVVVADSFYRLGVVLDLNGDGYQDSVAWWWRSATNQQLYLYPEINDQHGAFAVQGPASFTPGTGTSPAGLVSIRKCDLDHDARDDFFVVFNRAPGWNGTTSVNVFRSNGALVPQLVPTYTINGGTARVGAVVEDFDGDGTTDLAVAVGNQLSVYSFAPVPGGDPVPTLRATITLPAETDELFVIDANSDGHPDVYANMGGLGWIVPIVNFQPQAPIVVPHGVSSMPMPTAGDVDNDGDQDLVIFGMTDYVVMRRTGPVAWNLEPSASGGPATMLCDVDQDGFLDGLCCGGGGPSTPRNWGPSTFRVSLNDGTGRFAPAFEFPGLGSDHMAGAADLDHDGDVDLVAGRCVYYAHGPIAQPFMPTLATADKDRASVTDIDRDGDPDFRFVYGSVQRNLGSGESESFTPLCPPAPAGTTNHGPGWSGDFDGDGDVDLLVRNYSGSTITTWLYTNNGGGGFVDAGPAGPTGYDIAYGWPGMSPDRCIIADVDADGDLDLLVRSPTSSVSVNLYKNDGHGRFFDAPINLANCRAVAIADFNGDGIVDILNVSPALSVFFGTGGGAFTAGPAFSDPAGVYGAECADFGDLDGDGDLDLVVAAAGPNFFRTADVYWNDGSGTFTREAIPNTYLDYYPSQRVANAVDLNGDGLLDLVVGPALQAWSAAHVVLRRADNLGWEAPIQQTIYPEDSTLRSVVHQATVVDVDSDGDLDLVTDRVIHNAKRIGLEHGKRVQKTNATVGMGGMAPTLGVSGHFEVGGTTTIRLTGACGQASGRLTATWIGSQLPSFGGGVSSSQFTHPVRPTSVLSLVTSGYPSVAGSGDWTITYPVPVYKAGRTYLYRAWVQDPSSPTGSTWSNSLELTYGL